MHSDLAIDPDFQIIEVTQKPRPPIFIINLYNGKDANNIYTIDRVKQIPVPQQQITNGDLYRRLEHAPRKLVTRWLYKRPSHTT
jgi:hypothetical protein